MPSLRPSSSWFGLVGALALSGCAAFDADDSPDVVYSANSEQARTLQVPPDLTDVSDAEQFVLPGSSDGPITRNTLLPAVDGVRLERAEGRAWLAFDTAPEALWPRLVSFLRAQDYTVDRTSPVAGTLVTRWRPIEAEEREGGLLKGLIGGRGDPRSRVAFRLERASGTAGSRLFARRQVAPGKQVDAGEAPDWPAASADPEATDTLLAELLVFLGLDRQQSEGVLDASAAADVLDDAVVRSNAAGNQLVLHRGYRSAFELLAAALEDTGETVRSRDDSSGRIRFGGAAADDAGVGPGDRTLTLTVQPVHIGAVRVGVIDADGRRLDGARERDLLEGLRDSLQAA